MSAKHRARGRRRSRGAAMVEAIVVIPTFIILFSALIFAWQLYLTKIKVMSDSRMRVWAYAESNCGTPGDPGVGEQGGSSSPAGTAGVESGGAMDNGGNGGGVDTSDTSNVQGAGDAHLDTLSKSLGTAQLTSQSHVSANNFLGGFTSQVASTHKVMCNEPPYNGNLVSLLKAGYHDITSW